MKPAFKVSAAEQKRRNQSTMDLYAALADKPTVQLAEVRPKRPPAMRAKPAGAERSEAQEQAAVITWWGHYCQTQNLPPFALFSIPNGAHLAGGMIAAVQLKRQGMRPGVLDLFLTVPRSEYHGFYIEMKVGKNKPSDEQKAFYQFARSEGYAAGIYWSADDAINAIKKYFAASVISA